MKRIISAFLAAAVCTAAMSIVLTACSSKTADSSTTTPESTSTSTVTETAEDAADNTQIAGLGEIADIQQIYVNHTKAAMDALNG